MSERTAPTGEKESAWRLRVGLARTATPDFSPEEVWTLRGLSVPRRDSVTLVNASAVRKGVSLNLHGLAAVGRPAWPGEGNAGAWFKPTARLHIYG